MEKIINLSKTKFNQLINKKLGEYCDKEITFLNDAKKAIRSSEPQYIRVLKLKGTKYYE